MKYTVSSYYTDAAEDEHPWGEAFVIGSGDLNDYQASAREIVERMLTDNQPDGGHPLGIRIIDRDGEVVFTYVRSAPTTGSMV